MARMKYSKPPGASHTPQSHINGTVADQQPVQQQIDKASGQHAGQHRRQAACGILQDVSNDQRQPDLQPSSRVPCSAAVSAVATAAMSDFYTQQQPMAGAGYSDACGPACSIAAQAPAHASQHSQDETDTRPTQPLLPWMRPPQWQQQMQCGQDAQLALPPADGPAQQQPQACVDPAHHAQSQAPQPAQQPQPPVPSIVDLTSEPELLTQPLLQPLPAAAQNHMQRQVQPLPPEQPGQQQELPAAQLDPDPAGEPAGELGPSAADHAWEQPCLSQLAGGVGTGHAQAFCPRCGDYLYDIAADAAGRAAHVRTCGRTASSNGDGGKGGAGKDGGSCGPSVSSAAGDFECICLSDGDDEDDADGGSSAGQSGGKSGSAKQQRQGGHKRRNQQPPDEAVQQWLCGLSLADCCDAFAQAGTCFAELPTLTDADLQTMGIRALGRRRRIMAAAAELQADSSEDVASGSRAQSSAAASAVAAGAAASAMNSSPAQWRGDTGLKRITDFFAPPGGRKPPPPFEQPLEGGLTAAPKPRATMDRFLQRGAEPLAAVTEPRLLPAAQSCDRAGPAPSGAGGTGWLPEWQLLPGIRLVVDKFGPKTRGVPATAWFLTHFHADHYGGLSKRWCSTNKGLIYCTTPTAKLASDRLKVPWGRLACNPLNQPFMVETLVADGADGWASAAVRCTFLDANHCPGAVMVLFEAPGRAPILHAGDCRWQPGGPVAAHPAVAAVRGRCQLVLDTTYCAPQHVFPPQVEVIRFAVDAVRAEAFNPRTLFLFGSYTIGKERLFLEVARQLRMKVYVGVAKRKTLAALDLRPEYAQWLTTNEHEARIQAVPLGLTNLASMARIARHYKGRFNTVVAFRPTGWTAAATSRGRSSRGRRHQKGTLIQYQVPYSEHSSFEELRDMVATLQPTRIIPSVGNDRGPKAAHMVQLLRQGPPS